MNMHKLGFVGGLFFVAAVAFGMAGGVNAENKEGHRPLDVLKADWEVTQRIANDLLIKVDRTRVAKGREESS